jgi:hypothetical protein
MHVCMAGGMEIGQSRRMTTRRLGYQTDQTSLGHVRLYRDELEKIAAAVAEVGDLSIRCGHWKMTDPADLLLSSLLSKKTPGLTAPGSFA